MKKGLIIFVSVWAGVLAAIITFQVIGEITRENPVKLDTTGNKYFRGGEYREKKGNAN